MKFRIESQDLKRAASWTRSVSERVQADRILGCVLLESEADAVKFRGTDRNIEIECRVDAQVEQNGETTVLATTLNDFARRLPDGSQVSFEHIANLEQLRISSNRTNANLPTLPARTFPRMASEEYDNSFSLNADELGRLFEKSKIAVCQDSSREYLCGVNMHLAAEEGRRLLRCVATDGFQMAIVETRAPENFEEMHTTIVPSKAAGEIIKIFLRGDGPVMVAFTDSKIRFSNQTVSLSSRLLDGGRFPNYASLIPQNNPLKLTVDPDMLRDALLRVSVVADRPERSVAFELEENSLQMTVQDPAVGLVKEVIPVDFPHGKYSVGFKHGHLLAIIDQIGDGNLVFRFQSEPGAVRITTDSDKSLLYLLMPLKV